MFLAGKTALVTGGGRGIGRAIAERLAREGARVVVGGRTQAELDEVAAAVKGVALRFDVGDRRDVEAALAALRERALRVDVLVNNAGVAESAPFERTSDALWDRLFAINVTGAFALCRALIPEMVERGFGRVINVASNAGLTGYAYSSAYCASKHAMVGLTRAIALEIARTGVTINCVCPGWVNTRMLDEAVHRIAEKTGRGEDAARRALEGMSPQRRLVEPEEVAHAIAMLCSPEARSIHGQALPVDGGQVMA
jgi:NAD(P)-dependent dehydrogenase (short-subunit alcohol dehydrogenase family)